MQNATLVLKGKRNPNVGIYSYTDSPAGKLITAIFSEQSSKRIRIVNNKYRYTPSDEYKNYVLRFKGIRK